MCDGWGKSWAIGLLAVVKAFGELAWCCRLEVEGMRGRGVRKMLEEEGAGGGWVWKEVTVKKKVAEEGD